jgi:type I restriction-modification system DNA methylase subunit
MKLTLQQLEAHLWGAANILRGKTAGQDYKNYILSLMFFKRLCDQWEGEADDAIADLERQQGRSFTEQQKAVFRKRGEHRFKIPDGSRWGDVKAASTNSDCRWEGPARPEQVEFGRVWRRARLPAASALEDPCLAFFAKRISPRSPPAAGP